ncbi:hypothetical protein ScPMuIL_001163 [Solemya velum]
MARNMQVGLILCLFCAGCGVAIGENVEADPPTWGSSFIVSATLQLPYAGIVEPLTTYYDSINKRSRTDFYGGMVTTIQRADVNIGYKIAPMTTYNVKNQKTCFQNNGTENVTIEIQSLLPNLTGFTMTKTEQFNGQMCEVWKMVDMEGDKKNVYTMWVNNGTKAPVRYEMMGYDTLIGSHFDKYLLDYTGFQMNANISMSIFSIPGNLTCGGFPGPGAAQTVVLMNPLHEYIHNKDEHVTEAFDQFKQKHNRNYEDHAEHKVRLNVFRQNLRFIHSTNRAGKSYTVAVNHLADRFPNELKRMRGYHSTPGNHGGLPFDKTKYSLKDLPDQKDWRLYGAVTQVKDQAVCGSCWSFGTTGTIEGANFLKTGQLVRLSQQELMDCSWGEGNNGCDGGEDFRSYDWIMKAGGLSTEEQYGQYLAVGFEYSRSGNPTRNCLEKCIASLEGAKYGMCFSSGLATTMALTSLWKSGDHIVSMNDLYGGTNRYFQQCAVNMGIQTTMVDCTDTAKVKAALKSNTKMVWIETPTNPTMQMVDIAAVSKVVKAEMPECLVVVDNTFMSSYFQRPLDFGADVAMHSLTKYMNGHTDVVMGAVALNDEKVADRLRFLQNALGPVPSPFDSYLVNRGLKTLHLRMREHMKNGLAVAKFLESNPRVEKVIHPGLESHPQYDLGKRQMRGYSGMVTFFVKGGKQEASEFLKNLKVFALAESLGGYESLAELPSVMTHASVPPEERVKLGITDNLIRLSVGLEDMEDLIADLDGALKAAVKL